MAHAQVGPPRGTPATVLFLPPRFSHCSRPPPPKPCAASRKLSTEALLTVTSLPLLLEPGSSVRTPLETRTLLWDSSHLQNGSLLPGIQLHIPQEVVQAAGLRCGSQSFQYARSRN